MNVICKRVLMERAAKYPDAKSALQFWFTAAVGASWRSLVDVQKSFPATDMVGDLAIFNIIFNTNKGNHYRLIVRMAFHTQRVYIKEFLTHADYDKGGWKKWL